jgi:hypothetical protein
MQSTNTELRSLAARIDKLEAQNRKWKIATILLAASSAPLVLMAAKPADQLNPSVAHARTVEAQDFVLKDNDGQVRARLTVRPRSDVKGDLLLNPHRPALQFYDDNGQPFWTIPQQPGMIPATR